MDLVSKNYGSQSLPPITNPSSANSFFNNPHSHSSDTSFPIIAIAIIGILATAFLLVSYYIFVIKCCLNWHRIDILRRFSLSRNRNQEDPLMGYSPAMENRGLDESVIRSIPIFKFKKEGNSSGDIGGRTLSECAVCLNEFQENEKLRIIPNCSHVFHIDCIDVWLQNNANCPLCRNSISSTTRSIPFDRIIAPSSSPQDPNPYSESLIGGDEDYVVIELGNINNNIINNSHNPADQTLLAAQERLMNSGELSIARPISPSSRRQKLEQRGSSGAVQKKSRKFSKLTSMGDECIDIRGKDDQFAIQPIRRSFSMDSSADRQLYLSIQEIVLQSRQQPIDHQVSPIEGCSNGRPRRTFFSFGHGRGSRNSVLPVFLEP
ncbi:RING-H2 finger protein ATL16 [Ricinus communis]|uniref:RING-H2 finger protein ATL16 n=1 Tax=Ricinus communis TaxID=3988 RepID=UPI00201A7DD5|nr:RING-H2 finger protein ATL16 [Ricinus communis]